MTVLTFGWPNKNAFSSSKMIIDFVDMQFGWNDALVKPLCYFNPYIFVGYGFNRIGKSFTGIIISSLKHFHVVHSYESIPYCSCLIIFLCFFVLHSWRLKNYILVFLWCTLNWGKTYGWLNVNRKALIGKEKKTC